MQESYYVVNDCKRFIEINVEVKKISGAVRKVDEETFIEMLNEKKMEAQSEGYREVWINKYLEKKHIKSSFNHDKKTEIESGITEIFRSI